MNIFNLKAASSERLEGFRQTPGYFRFFDLRLGVSDLQIDHEFVVATTKQPITAKIATEYCNHPQRNRNSNYIGVTLVFDGMTKDMFAGENINVAPGHFTFHEGQTEQYFLRIYGDLKDDKVCITRLSKEFTGFAADALGGYTSLDNLPVYKK